MTNNKKIFKSLAGRIKGVPSFVKKEMDLLKKINMAEKKVINQITAKLLEGNMKMYPKYIDLLKCQIANNEEIVIEAEKMVEEKPTRQLYKQVALVKEAVKIANSGLNDAKRVLENSYTIEGIKLRKLSRKTDADFEITETMDEIGAMLEESVVLNAKDIAIQNLEEAYRKTDEWIAEMRDSKRFLKKVKEKESLNFEEELDKADKADQILEKLLIAFSEIYKEAFNRVINNDFNDDVFLSDKKIGYVFYRLKDFVFEFGIGSKDISLYSDGEVLFKNDKFNPNSIGKTNSLYVQLIGTKFIK